ncbi:MAG: hypothetical protein ACE5FT_06535 [Candidatus Nanoarchaeia archaeon]
MGFPGFLGPVISVLELVAALLVLVGSWFTYANYMLAAIIAVAIIGVQIPKGVTAGLERDLLLVASNLALAAFGSGKFAWKRK